MAHFQPIRPALPGNGLNASQKQTQSEVHAAISSVIDLPNNEAKRDPTIVRQHLDKFMGTVPTPQRKPALSSIASKGPNLRAATRAASELVGDKSDQRRRDARVRKARHVESIEYELDLKWGGQGWLPPDVRQARLRGGPCSLALLRPLLNITKLAIQRGWRLQSLWEPGGLLRRSVSNGPKGPRLSKEIAEEAYLTLKLDMDAATPTSTNSDVSDNGVERDNDYHNAEWETICSSPEIGRQGFAVSSPRPDDVSSVFNSRSPQLPSPTQLPDPWSNGRVDFDEDPGTDAGFDSGLSQWAKTVSEDVARRSWSQLTSNDCLLDSAVIDLLCKVFMACWGQSSHRILDPLSFCLDDPRIPIVPKVHPGTNLFVVVHHARHWTLVAIRFDSSTADCHFYDSLPWKTVEEAIEPRLRAFLSQFNWVQSVQFTREPLEPQNDQVSCGVFVTVILRCLIRGTSVPARIVDPAGERRSLLNDLISCDSALLEPTSGEVLKQIQSRAVRYQRDEMVSEQAAGLPGKLSGCVSQGFECQGTATNLAEQTTTTSSTKRDSADLFGQDITRDSIEQGPIHVGKQHVIEPSGDKTRMSSGSIFPHPRAQSGYPFSPHTPTRAPTNLLQMNLKRAYHEYFEEQNRDLGQFRNPQNEGTQSTSQNCALRQGEEPHHTVASSSESGLHVSAPGCNFSSTESPHPCRLLSSSNKVETSSVTREGLGTLKQRTREEWLSPTTSTQVRANVEKEVSPGVVDTPLNQASPPKSRPLSESKMDKTIGALLDGMSMSQLTWLSRDLQQKQSALLEKEDEAQLQLSECSQQLQTLERLEPEHLTPQDTNDTTTGESMLMSADTNALLQHGGVLNAMINAGTVQVQRNSKKAEMDVMRCKGEVAELQRLAEFTDAIAKFKKHAESCDNEFYTRWALMAKHAMGK